MDEDRKKQIVAVVVILAILLIGLILFFLLRKKPEPPPPPPAPTTTAPVEKPAPKVEKLPDFIEKTEFYDTKELKAKYYVYRVKPETRHKEYKEYYKSGKIKVECVYKDGEIDGAYVHYHENGQKALEGKLINGVKDGAFTELYPGGRKKFSYNYAKGRLDGQWQEFYDLDNSPPAIEKIYRNGELISEIHKKLDGSVKLEKNHSPEPQDIK